MNHEPECRSYAAANDYPACICGHLKSAYQRGREDAAADVETVKEYPKKHNDLTWSFLKRGDAIVAALGGKQE